MTIGHSQAGVADRGDNLLAEDVIADRTESPATPPPLPGQCVSRLLQPRLWPR
jgi:hypothetical protein